MASEPEASSSEAEAALIGEPPSSSSIGDATGEPKSAPAPRPFGQWPTIGWTLVCVLAMAAAPDLVQRIMPLEGPSDAAAQRELISADGNLLAASTFLSTLLIIVLVSVPVKLRGWRLRDYFALSWPSARAIALAFVGVIVLCVGSDWLSHSLGRPLVPDVMVQFYRHAWLPFLILAIVAVGPVGEEVLFRGFLYRGIAETRAGPVGAVALSSIVFGILHIQYDLFDMVLVTAVAFYFGFVRYKTNSLPLLILLHATQNAVGTIEVFVQENWLK
jgi:uncharacterized protein